MVGVAQLVERRVVVADVAGSSPVVHPTRRRLASPGLPPNRRVRGQARGRLPRNDGAGTVRPVRDRPIDGSHHVYRTAQPTAPRLRRAPPSPAPRRPGPGATQGPFVF